MGAGRKRAIGAACLTAILVAGCGGNDDEKSATSKATTSKPATTDHRISALLPKPLYPRCGTDGYDKGQPRKGPGLSTKVAWQVVYTPPRQALSEPAKTKAIGSTFVLIEEPGTLPLELAKSRPGTIGGRKSLIVKGAGTRDAYVVQTKTSTARYTVLVNGGPLLRAHTILSRVFPCLP